ncbi:hypothetical protein LCGC14_2881090, partial [marine sediment metagenome]
DVNIDNTIHALPGNLCYPEIVRNLEMQRQILERLSAHALFAGLEAHSRMANTQALPIGMTATQLAQADMEMRSAMAVCNPHRAPFMCVDVAIEDEEPKRKTVDSREVEVKLLTE